MPRHGSGDEFDRWVPNVATASALAPPPAAPVSGEFMRNGFAPNSYGPNSYGGHAPLPHYPSSKRKRAASRLLTFAAIVAVVVGGTDRIVTEVSQANRAAAVQRVLPQLERFVAAERGHPFKRTVAVTLLGDDEFLAKLNGDSGGDSNNASAPASDPGTTFAALHLVSSADAFHTATDDATSSGVVGFYDPDAKKLYVRGTKMTPDARVTLVHELTHALDDQYFDLRKAPASGEDEKAAAYQGLAEGDAVRVERAYYDTLSASDQKSVDDAENGGADTAGDNGNGPSASDAQLVEDVMGFPYSAGPEFVQALLDAGGNKAVDQAFRHPPVSTEQLLDPPAYLHGDEPAPVPAPQLDGKKVDGGVLGDMGFTLLVSGGDAEKLADSQVAGWAGDHYITVQKPNWLCTRDTVTLDDAAHAAKLRAALGHWSGTVTPINSTTLRLDSCTGTDS
jgi:hypothetical protein